MPHDNWLDPVLVEAWIALNGFYGDDLPELLRQYAALAEKFPMVLADMETFGFTRETTFVVGDAQASAFKEGHRRMALRFLALANLTEEQQRRLEELDGGRNSSGDRLDRRRRKAERYADNRADDG